MKRKMKWNKKIACMLFVVCMAGRIQPYLLDAYAYAATTNKQTNSTSDYITVSEFIKQLVQALGLPVDQKRQRPYITAAYERGILKQGDVSTLDGYMTREECAVVLERAERELHDTKLDPSYLKRIIEKRISDLSNISPKNREAIASIYGKGIIEGYSDGVGVQSRSFRGARLLTARNAKVYIQRVIRPSKRLKLSPDGLLIRTSNLPSNASKFDYILECFPNEFYETKFRMERIRVTGSFVEGRDYIYPVNMKDGTFNNWYKSYDMKEQMELYLDDWTEYIERYVALLFNVDHRTIGEDWCNSVREISYIHHRMDEYLKSYIEHMKYYKTTIQTRKIAVEPSTLYFSGGHYMRVYIEYKITATELMRDKGEYIFSMGADIPELVLGKWMTGYFDFVLTPLDGFNGDGSSLRPDLTFIIS